MAVGRPRESRGRHHKRKGGQVIDTGSTQEASSTDPAPRESVGAPRVRVRIRRTREGESGPLWVIELHGATFPKKSTFRRTLRSKSALIPNDKWDGWAGVRDIVSYSIETGKIDPQSLADAVAEAAIVEMAESDPAYFSESILGAAPEAVPVAMGAAYLTVGQGTFKLVPTALGGHSSVLAAVRARVQQKALAEVHALKAAAQREATVLVEQATQALLDADRSRRSAGAILSRAIPGWADEVEDNLAFTTSGEIGMGLKMRIPLLFCPQTIAFDQDSEEGRSDTFRFPANRAPAVAVGVWVELDPATGNYDQDSFHTIHPDPELPHISEAQCCMEAPGLPQKLNDKESYLLLKRRLEEFLSEIQLNSMLFRIEALDPRISAFVPEELAGDYLHIGHAKMKRICEKLGGTFTSLHEEEDSTWNLEDK